MRPLFYSKEEPNHQEGWGNKQQTTHNTFAGFGSLAIHQAGMQRSSGSCHIAVGYHLGQMGILWRGKLWPIDMRGTNCNQYQATVQLKSAFAVPAFGRVPAVWALLVKSSKVLGPHPNSCENCLEVMIS